MNNDFRQRVFLPILLPVGVIVGFFGFAWMLSRVLLAVEEMASTAIALGLATYILGITALVAARPRITSRALAVGVTLGVVAIVAAGTVAAATGMRDIHHEEEAAAGGDHGGEAPAGEGEEGEGGGEAAEDGTLQWVAVDIDFAETPPETVSAGEKTVVLVNEGQALHNVTMPKLQETPIVEAPGGETAEATVTLEPGTYEFFCSVPGHEDLMNGELTVE